MILVPGEESSFRAMVLTYKLKTIQFPLSTDDEKSKGHLEKFNKARGEIASSIGEEHFSVFEAGHWERSPVLSTNYILCCNIQAHGRTALSCIFHVTLANKT